MTTRSFAADVSKFVEKTGLNANLVLRRVAFDAYQGLIDRSPVDTGRFRGSWRLGVNRPDLTVEAERTKEQGVLPAPKVPGQLSSAKFGDTLYITNNLPYAEALEKGHSNQAPQGVLGRTFDDITLNFGRSVDSVTKGT